MQANEVTRAGAKVQIVNVLRDDAGAGTVRPARQHAVRRIRSVMASRIQAARARKDFANVVDRSSRGERIKVTRYGRTLAAIIPKSDLDKLEDCEESDVHKPGQAGRRRH